MPPDGDVDDERSKKAHPEAQQWSEEAFGQFKVVPVAQGIYIVCDGVIGGSFVVHRGIQQVRGIRQFGVGLEGGSQAKQHSMCLPFYDTLHFLTGDGVPEDQHQGGEDEYGKTVHGHREGAGFFVFCGRHLFFCFLILGTAALM
jgi:hypothetical protein